MGRPGIKRTPFLTVKTMPKMTICVRGDVILKLGREVETTTELLVSSVALSLVSPVFMAMLSGQFKESRALSIESPPTLPLPEDDLHAMLLLCSIAHFRTADIPPQISPQTFADFAIVCDKYQCREAVQAWSKVWMAKLFTLPSLKFEKTILVTYVLDLPEEFQKATLIFIRDRVENIKIASASHGYDILPLFLFDKLLDEKRQCERKAYALIENATSALGTCDGSKKIMASIMTSLRKSLVWSAHNSCVGAMNHHITNMEDIPKPTCVFGCSVCPLAPAIKQTLVAKMKEVFHSVEGLCLDCIKCEAGGTARVCRVHHRGAVIKIPETEVPASS